jgi:hypothetical protein
MDSVMRDVRFRVAPGLSSATLLLLVAVLAYGAEELFPDLVPRPSLEPAEVVRIQLEALAANDTPRQDAGIEITFRFASPGNKEQTGPLPRFIELVKNPVYSPMIGHKHAEYGNTYESVGRVMVPVLLTGSDDNRAAYVFVLRRQEVDGCRGCWMTESVLRVRLSGSDPGAAAPRLGA